LIINFTCFYPLRSIVVLGEPEQASITREVKTPR
jgi:hypothetical protein